MKMNLSRAAKKFRALMPDEPEAPKRAKSKKQNAQPTPPPPAPQPVVETIKPADPVPEPELPESPAEATTPVPAAPSKKAWRVKTKRPRFVREKAERRERVPVPALLGRSAKPVARLLTKNLALPPKDDPKTSR